MKSKVEILEAILDKEMIEESNPRLQSSLSERLARLSTTDPKEIEKIFRVKLDSVNYWGVSQEVRLGLLRKEVLASIGRQVANRRARSQAADIGLHYWPALLPSHDGGVDPAAFVAAEKSLLSGGAKPWGTKVEGEPEVGGFSGGSPKNQIEHGGWDSAGHWGISPNQVRECWLASGCKDSSKFRYLVRHTRGSEDVYLLSRRLKQLSVRQLRDLKRGLRWVKFHFKREQWRFSTKAIIALGRISPAARKAATRDINGSLSYVRIRDLNWGAVKALQGRSREEITARYLMGHYAWQFLQGINPPEGLETVSPVGWSEDQNGVWSSKTITYQKFSIIAPEGYAFGVDQNGVKIYEAENPEEDYHFYESDAKWLGGTGLVDQLLQNEENRRKERAKKIEIELMMSNLHIVMVTRHDSYRAGNCAAGTASFAKNNNIDQTRPIRADILLRLAKGAHDSVDRVMGAIRCAWERETLVQI